MNTMALRAAIITLASALLMLAQAANALELGIFADPDSGIEAKAQWDWAIRGASLQFAAPDIRSARLDAGSMPLVVLEDACLSGEAFESLESWIEAGGLLVVNGLDCGAQDGAAKVRRQRARLAGLSVVGSDPGLPGVYPRVTANTPILAPFAVGDGIRLGQPGIARTARVEADSADVLARGYRIEPGPGDWVRPGDAVTISSRSLGRGRVVFLNFSLAEVTACYPDSRGEPTDCSGTGTARGLMRFLVANLLWEERGQQIPLRRETPGSQALGVVLTGDVHGGEEAYQVRSARLMAERIASAEAPLTYFIVGEVSQQSPEHFAAVNRSPGVVLGAHSAQGRKYQAGDPSGAEAVYEDIREAESLLAIPSYDKDRRWRAGIRSHGWASDQPAWAAMDRAGISVVLDHNADSVLPEVNVSAPVEWFEAEVRQRLFVPMLERSVHTEADDFVVSEELEGQIFSLGSPEPDPCCNWSVTFDTYTDYVASWHQQFLKLGAFGGATAVWLWHPSTPVWKGGLDGVERFVDSLVANRRTKLFSAHEFATWAYNRERVRVIPQWDSSGRLDALSARFDPKALAPLPPGARAASGTVGYWVIGPADVEGWRARQAQDPFGRTLTILTRPLPQGRLQP